MNQYGYIFYNISINHKILKMDDYKKILAALGLGKF